MRLRIAVAVIGIGAVVCQSPDAFGETLAEALAATYEGNPTLQAERAAVRGVNEQVPQALSNWRPSMRAIGEIGRAQRNPNPGNTSYLTPRDIRGEIRQPLYRGGRTLAATRAAEHSVLAARSRLTAVEQGVLLDGVTAYVNVLAAQAVLTFEIQNEQRLARFLEATSDRFTVGEVTRTDVFQAEARLARATGDRVQAEGDLAAARAAYRNVIGQEPVNLELPELPEDLPASLAEAVDVAIDRNPNVIAAEYQERAARDAVDERRGELLPTLDLVGEASRTQDVVARDQRLDDIRGTVELSVPIYQRGAEYSRIRQAKQNVAERLKILDQVRRDARQEATSAWNDLQAARAQVSAFTTEVRANEVAVEGVEREQAVGTRTVLDVLDTQRDLLESQRNLVRVRRDEIREGFRLIAAVGRLTAAELGLPVTLYDPRENYNEVRDSWFGTSSSGDISDEPVLRPR